MSPLVWPLSSEPLKAIFLDRLRVAACLDSFKLASENIFSEQAACRGSFGLFQVSLCKPFFCTGWVLRLVWPLSSEPLKAIFLNRPRVAARLASFKLASEAKFSEQAACRRSCGLFQISL